MQDASVSENLSTSCFLPFKGSRKAAANPSWRLCANKLKIHLLLRIQLDDKLFAEGRRLDIFPLGQRHYFGFELITLLLKPWHRTLALRYVARFDHHRVLVHLFLDGHFLADIHEVRGDVDLLPVDADVPVQYELPRLRTR